LERQAYERLIADLEVEAAHSPAVFRSKVLLLSCAVYLVLFATLALAATGLYYGFTWASGSGRASMLGLGLLALSMLPVFYVVLRMVFMRLAPPGGRRLDRADAPKLFALLDKMRRRLAGPDIHHVLIDDRFNAGVSQVPRWGFFGGHTNYLLLGLPYLLAVPRNEMVAAVAHEYGHLCGNHGKLAAWVYRQRRTLGALYEQVGENRDDTALNFLAAGLDRFMPYFNAYTFVLSRQNEYDADLTATRLVGAESNARGLIRDALLGRWISEEFWSTIYKQADHRPNPAFLPYAAMRTAFKASYDQWATRERLADAWRAQSESHHTHPALRDRIEATGQPSQLPTPVEVTAAEALLGPALAKRLIEEFDQAWWKKEQKEWEARHRYVSRSKTRLLELLRRPLHALPLTDLQELALLNAEFDSPQASKPVLDHLLKQPGGPFPKAAYVYGRILLDENDDRGLEHLASAATCDRSLTEHAAHLGYAYLREKRGQKAAQAWWDSVLAQNAGES
jgi:hypothetical protein